MEVPESLLKTVRKAESFLLVTHMGPDGDAVGSALGLYHTLRTMGKKPVLLDVDPVPRIYEFLPGHEAYVSEVPSGEFDMLVMLDCGEIERTGFDQLPGKIRAVIDHHLTERDFGDIRWVLPSASSTGEMVYHLAGALGVDIDEDAALCLYTAIFTDTGGFRYSGATSSSFRAAAHMVDKGVDPWYVTEHVYESPSMERVTLMGKAMAGLKLRGQVALISVTDGMYAETGTSAEDTENFANMARGINGVEVGIFLRQLAPDAFKVSMRSKGRVNVAAIAESLGGGGHHNAAGAVLRGTLEEAENRIFSIVQDAIGRHKP